MSLLAPLWIAIALSANPYLEEGQRLYDGLQYKQAEAQLRLALDSPTNTLDERRRVHDLLARCLLAQARGAEAERVYSRLLAADPNAPAPHGSPKVTEAYRRAKEHLYPKDFAKLVEGRSAPGVLRFQVVDPWESIAQVNVFSRDASGAFGATELDLRTFDGTLAVSAPVFIEARDRNGNVVASLGSRSSPLALEPNLVPPPPPSSTPPSEPFAQVAAPPSPYRPSRWAPFAALALGAASATVGAVTYLGPANADYAAAGNASFASRTLPLDQRARSEYVAADGLMVGGLVVAAAGALWLGVR